MENIPDILQEEVADTLRNLLDKEKLLGKDRIMGKILVYGEIINADMLKRIILD